MEVERKDNEMDIEPNEEEIDIFEFSFKELEISTTNAAEKLKSFKELLSNPRTDDNAIKIKEQCIYSLAKIYAELNDFNEVINILKSNNEFFSFVPKARAAKIVRNILNIVSSVPDSLQTQVELCKDIIEWCKVEKRTFLRQRIEAKLANLLLQLKQPARALEIIDELLTELKKLDDKQMLTESHLTESRIYHSLQNIPKAKASLTACRTAANSIYVVPLLQAEIDEMSGILHCEESDYATAYSYFLESYDAYDQGKNPVAAISCLKYMALCKILNESSHEVPALLSSKIAAKYSGIDLEAMSIIAKAAKSHSLEDFQKSVDKFESVLRSDYLISHHLDILYDKMLESNLLKIINPYRTVEITHISKLIKLSDHQVVQKLSQMILDHKFFGILDQGRGQLIIYDSSSEDKNFSRASEIVANLSQVVDILATRAKDINKERI